MRKLDSLDLGWLPTGTTQFVVVRTPYPDIPNLAHLVLAATVSRATIDALMGRLPEGQSLSFFDPDFPSPNDPGAYFRIERSSGTLFIRAANHGWSTGWRVIDPARAADYLWGCRHSSMQPEHPLTLGLEGNRLELMPDTVRAAGLQGYGAAQEVASWSMVADGIFEAGVSRTAPVAACVVGGWTLIPSGEIALAAFEGSQALASLVQSHAMSLFSVVAESATGMYGYRLTEPGGTRLVLVEGSRLEGSGTALTCERPIVVDTYTEEDLMEVMDHLGIDFENGLEDASPILVWRHA